MTETPKTFTRSGAGTRAAGNDGITLLGAPHAMATDDVVSALGTRQRGLSEAEAAERLARYGPNSLPAPPGRSPVLRFLSHFHNVLIYVLIGAAVITAGFGHPVDTGVILAVVIANATIGFVQEGRAEQAMEAIRQMIAPAPRFFEMACAAASTAPT